MATITPIKPSTAGTDINPTAAAGGGDVVTNTRGRVVLRVNNGSGAPITVTAAAVQTARPAEGPWPQMTLANLTVQVPAGDSRLIGPIPPAFNNASGQVALTYSDVTTVTVEAYELD